MKYSRGIRESPREAGALGNRIEVEIDKDHSFRQLILLVALAGERSWLFCVGGEGGPNPEHIERVSGKWGVLVIKSRQ